MNRPLELPASPRLRHLASALSSGDETALDRFWDEVAEHGTPLVEPDPDSAHHALVTFLWREASERADVLVMSFWQRFDPVHDQMERLGTTDCWYRTHRLPSDLRGSYWLSPNDSLVALDTLEGYEAYQRRFAAARPDPLNRQPLASSIDDRWTVRSTFALPAARSEGWSMSQTDRVRGRIEEERFPSGLLGNTRRIWTYTPMGEPSGGGPYELLIVFDGSIYVDVVPVPTILDNLIGRRLIPPTVAVMVDNAGDTVREQTEARDRELPCNPLFAEFLVQELVPVLRERFHLLPGPQGTTLAGSSFGGLAALYGALRHPAVFGNVLSQSGAFQWKPGHDPYNPALGAGEEDEWLARQIVEGTKVPVNVYLDVGVFDTRVLPGERPGILLANRHLRNVLRAKGYSVHYTEFCGGHDYVCWRETFAGGLQALRGSRG